MVILKGPEDTYISQVQNALHSQMGRDGHPNVEGQAIDHRIHEAIPTDNVVIYIVLHVYLLRDQMISIVLSVTRPCEFEASLTCKEPRNWPARERRQNSGSSRDKGLASLAL
jgi:hypothetical protein